MQGAGQGITAAPSYGNVSQGPSDLEGASIIQVCKRVMCLMSDTGGGHRASAQALKDGFEVLYGNACSNCVFLRSASFHLRE